jgi:hypothetical protein
VKKLSQRPSDQMKAAIRLPVTISGSGSEEFLILVKREFHIEDTKSIRIVDSAFDGRDSLLYLSFVRDASLKGKELREAEGLVVELGGTLTLRFDSAGTLDSYFLNDSLDSGIEETKSGVIGLMNQGKIYIAQPGEKVDVSKLVREGIPFYMQEDLEGKKRLFRAYVD